MAHALDRQGVGFRVIDPGTGPSASRAAAGLLNPLTGPRFTGPDPVEIWFHSALAHWRLLERRLQRTLLHQGPLYRLFRDDRERRMAQRQWKQGGGQLIRLAPGAPRAGINAPLGCAVIQAGQVDLPAFLDATRDWLAQSGRLIAEPFQPQDVQANRGARPCWRGQTLSAIVFCAGHRLRDWPWFQHLPWRMSHGQALILTRTQELGPHMLSRGKNLVPLDAERAWLGGSYERYTEPTRDQAGRESLLAALDSLFERAPAVDVREQLAGVRAGNREGALFAGRHPQYPGLVLFGGLGSRGTLLAPPASTALASHLVSGTPLPPGWKLPIPIDEAPTP